MKYTIPPSAALRRKYIVPSRCGDGFDEEDRIVTTLQPLELAVMGINVWYDSDEEPSVNHLTRSGRLYQPIEKDMVRERKLLRKSPPKRVHRLFKWKKIQF